MVLLGLDQRLPAKQHQEALAAAALAIDVSCDREQGIHKASGASHLCGRGRKLPHGCQAGMFWHTWRCKNFVPLKVIFWVLLSLCGPNSTVMVHCTVSASK